MNKQEIEQTIIDLADAMASSASSFNSHGYFQFLEARQSLIDTLHSFLTVYPNK
jgi:hypothetical protein